MQPLKRRRTELACTECRLKKAKCDGSRPSCSSCQQDRRHCRYETSASSHITRQNVVSRKAGLEERVAQLERELAAARKAGLNQQHRSQPSDPEPEDLSQPTYSEHGATSTSVAETTVAIAANEVSDDEGIVDTLATTAFSHESEVGIGHFGPSSNHGYFRALSNVFAHLPKDGSAANPKSLHRWSQFRQVARESTVPAITESQISDTSSGPDVSTAIYLFTQFFAAMSLTTQYISRSTVIRNFNQAREGHFRKLRKVRRALFNILWAHGAICADRNDFEVFYRRAVRFLNSITIREASDELVQLLLLICRYQQNQRRSVTSWTFHALAVKTAFQMGLHSPSTYEGLSADNRQQRQQLWLGVLNQDRFLAPVLGRPCLIPRQHSRIQIASLPESSCLGGEAENLSGSKAAELTTQLTKFYDIVATIVETLYDHNITTDLPELEDLLARRLQLSLRLESWKVSIPSSWSPCPALELQHKTIDEMEPLWPRAFLAIHYCRAQLLINGPPIIFALREWVFGNDGLPHATTEVLASLLQNDFHAGKELIAVVRELVRPSSRLLQRHGMWFLSNYSVFAACVHFFGILLACAKRQTLLFNAGISLPDVRSSLQEGLELLKTVGSRSLMSQKGAACLTTFLDVFDSFVTIEAPSHSFNPAPYMDPTTSLVSMDASQPTIGLLSDFIMQTTDDFFFDGVSDSFSFGQYSDFRNHSY